MAVKSIDLISQRRRKLKSGIEYADKLAINMIAVLQNPAAGKFLARNHTESFSCQPLHIVLELLGHFPGVEVAIMSQRLVSSIIGQWIVK